MKRFVPLVIVCLSLSYIVSAQSVMNFAPSGVEMVQSYTNESTELPAQPTASTTVGLSYYINSPSVYNWQFPRNFGSFINLFLYQRFTLPNNLAFLDSISVYITDIDKGGILIRVRPDTIIDLAGGSFRFPNYNYPEAIDSVIVDKSSLKMNEFNTIKMRGRLVPKEFFVSVEFTVSGGTNNVVTLRGDSHVKARRSLNDSRVIMLNQAGTALQFAVLDSLLVNSQTQEPIFSNLFMRAFVDTATSSEVPKIVTTPKLNAYTDQLYKYDIHAIGIPRPAYSLIKGPAGLTVEWYTGEVRWTPTSAQLGDHQVIIRALNPNGTDEQSFTITVVQATPPKITSYAKTKAIVNEPYFYQVTATGGPEPTFRLGAAPSGMTIDPITGKISMTPTFSQLGVHIVGVIATNALGNDTQTFNLKIDAAASAPKITSQPPLSIKIGEDFKYQVIADGNPQPTFSLTKSPAGMTIDVNSGLVEWKAPAEGAYDVIIRAENRVNFEEQAFTLNVTPGASLPVFTSTPVTEAIAGQSYSYTAVATGIPTPKYSLVVAPGGMQVNELSGLVTWDPQRSHKGQNPVTIRATNTAGTTDQQFSVYVLTIPRITSTEVFTAKVDEQYKYQVVAEAEPAATFSLSQAPTGMTIDTTTGLIAWIPTIDQVGQHVVIVVATNKAGSTQQQYTVDVQKPTGIESSLSRSGYYLTQNYPNPVSASKDIANFEYAVPVVSDVKIEIRNILGRTIATLVNGRKEAGSYTVSFSSRSLQVPLPAGVYFIQMRAGSFAQTRLMTIIK